MLATHMPPAPLDITGDANAAAQQAPSSPPRKPGPFVYLLDKRRILGHKYTSQDNSLLAKYVLTHFWNWAVELLPRTLAPNAVTLIGTLPIVAALGLVCIYMPTLTEPAPRWVYLYFAVTTVFYQTMDALDGKQARRTHSSSCLGEFFDHGCDSFVCTIVSIMLCATLQAGARWEAMLLVTFVSFLAFFAAHWEEFHTHKMILGRVNGPNEGTYALALTFLITAIVGGGVWNSSWRVLRDVLVLLNAVGGTGITLFLNFKNTFHVVLGKNSPTGDRECPSDSISEALRVLTPVCVLCTFSLLYPMVTPKFYTENVVLAIVMQLFVFAFINGRLLIAHMAHEPFPAFYPVFYVLIAVLVNSCFGLFDELTVLIVATLLNAAQYVHFVYTTIHDMVSVLHIKVLTIGKTAE